MTTTTDPIESQPDSEPLNIEPLSAKTRLALAVAGIALALGILGDLLVHEFPLGINIFLWLLALIASVTAVARLRTEQLAGGIRWLALPLILFGCAIVWHDSASLQLINLLAILILLSLATLRVRLNREYPTASITDYIGGVFVAGFDAVTGYFMVFNEGTSWEEIPHGNWKRRSAAIGRGLLFAIPLLILFGSLLASADAVFESILVDVLRLDIEEVIGHTLRAIGLAWITAGFLRGVLLGTAVERESNGERAFSIGFLEVTIVVGLLDLLFLGFVTVQFQYFFGGADVMQLVEGMTYATYARRGFFELVTVTALVIPLLLSLDWMFHNGTPSQRRTFRLLSAVQIGLLLIIVVAAIGRMRIYQDAYGQTELRLYTTAFMIWLGTLLVWFTFTVLRDRRRHFAFGALIAGLLTIATLNVLNPSAVIVGTNMTRALHGAREYDSRYVLGRIDADAVPTILEHLPKMPEIHRGQLAQRLLMRWPGDHRIDWRSWTLAEQRAFNLIDEQRTQLENWSRIR